MTSAQTPPTQSPIGKKPPMMSMPSPQQPQHPNMMQSPMGPVPNHMGMPPHMQPQQQHSYMQQVRFRTNHQDRLFNLLRFLTGAPAAAHACFAPATARAPVASHAAPAPTATTAAAAYEPSSPAQRYGTVVAARTTTASIRSGCAERSGRRRPPATPTSTAASRCGGSACRQLMHTPRLHQSGHHQSRVGGWVLQ